MHTSDFDKGEVHTWSVAESFCVSCTERLRAGLAGSVAEGLSNGSRLYIRHRKDDGIDGSGKLHRDCN